MQAPYVDGWVSLRDKVRSAVKSGASQVSVEEIKVLIMVFKFFHRSLTFPGNLLFFFPLSGELQILLFLHTFSHAVPTRAVSELLP